MKVAVIGANGQLGEDVTSAFRTQGHEVAALNHSEIAIESPESVQAALETCRPDLVVNTAAFTNVDRCEDEAALAFTINGVGARNIARVTHDLGAKLIQISTDYVFDGEKGSAYVETDAPRPLSVYGNSKLAGEFFARAATARHFVVRVSGIYGRHVCRGKGGPNFVDTMLARGRRGEDIRMVEDQIATPTPTAEIARQIVALGQTAQFGIYHATAEGSCSWYEFTLAIFDLAGLKVRVQPIKTGDSGRKAPRPKYGVLENAALKRLSLNLFSNWRVGLENYLKGS
jgi:dTDP-4-dehydrorhamnose reductase